MHHFQFSGAGLGLRACFSQQLLSSPLEQLSFLEIAPENWINVHGKRYRHLKEIAQKYPLIAHGLNLSIGGPAPLDLNLIADLKSFFDDFQIKHYSEHLSYSCDEAGYLYDLLPIPFTDDAVNYVSQRIIEVQDRLKMQIAFENSSYYYAPHQTLTEIEFINAVVKSSNCLLLLDVNNVYVNSVNHQYNPYDFIAQLPSNSIAYLHIAGHLQKSSELIIDTHGADVIPEVWSLLAHTYRCHGNKPTLLERDTKIPPLDILLKEVDLIKQYQKQGSSQLRSLNQQEFLV